MAQHDMNIANQSFPDFRTDLNNALSAINSMHSGTSRPSGAVAGTMWLDTTSASSPVIKFFDGSDDITFATVDYSANTINFSDSASDLVGDTTPQLGGQLDVNGNSIGDGTRELLKFIETASAVNELTITNNATGNSPELSSTGDDSNINLKLKPKGTGVIEVMGATNPGSIQLNCESNSHGIKLTSPAHTSAQSYELKFPTTNVTAGKFLKVDSVSGSGATGVGQLSFADAGGGTSWQSSVKTANFTAAAGEGYFINTSGGAFEVDLPTSPSVGDQIEFVDFSRNFATANLTLDQGSNKFQGNTSPKPIYSTDGQNIKIVYSGSTQGWIPLVDDDVTMETPQAIQVEYLVIGGGGAGGGSHRGGGGGAGGYRNSYASETSGRNSSTETPYSFPGAGTQITVTVGGGGAVSSAANGGKGGDSSISASGQTTITSYGGGGGGEYQSSADAGTYGSGAGAGHSNSSVYNGSSGTAGQGFDGAGSGAANSTPQGGSGGGAGASGQTGGTTSPTAGGVGLSSSITGSAVFRAGGGGAGGYGIGGYSSGGNGGGGNGGSDDASDPHSGVIDSGSYYFPVSGVDGTGGGGGGTADDSNTTTRGRGGSGVVILRVATSDYSGTTSGSPTVTTDGSYKVIKFTSSGSYTT